MAITLRGDNRQLTLNSKYSYLVDNTPSASYTIIVANVDGFDVDKFILVGEFGQENAEIFRIGAVTSAGVITLKTAAGGTTTTNFAHSESSKVYVIPYNQIRFYWTAATGTIADEDPTFDTNNPLSAWFDLDTDSWYSVYADDSHSTGFGWFLYRNSVSSEASQNSNPIPYTGFETNTVATIFEGFNSLLNTNELKLVTNSDRFAWINEALAIFRNKLNLTNTEYTVSAPITISIVPGTSEYLLETDFSDLIGINDGTTSKNPIPFMSISRAMSYAGSDTHYYMRGRYIGFVPTPSTAASYVYRYKALAARLTSLSDYIVLPDNAFYVLNDWMLYRAYSKFQNTTMAKQYYDSFTNFVNLEIQASVKRDANLDVWGIEHSANV